MLATTATSSSPVNSYPITQGKSVRGQLHDHVRARHAANHARPAHGHGHEHDQRLWFDLAGVDLHNERLRQRRHRGLGRHGSLATTATSSSPVASYPISQGTLSAANYTITFVPGTLQITPAPLTVTATSTTSVYGSTLPALTYTTTAFVNGDTAVSASTALATTATSSSPVASYPISQGTLSAANYTITFVPGTLQITPAPLTVTATSTTKVYGTLLPTLTYTTSGLVNGDTATTAFSGSLATTATAPAR